MVGLHKFGVLLPALLLGACMGGDGVEEQSGPVPVPDDPDRFLEFLDRQPGLPAGVYRVVAATAAPGVAGRFDLQVSFTDGRRRSESGRWTASGGRDPGHGGNPVFEIELSEPGGLTLELRSQQDAYLYLTDAGGGNVIAEDDNSAGAGNARILLPGSYIDSARYATAYYAVVDPDHTRTTLADWQIANGFDRGVDAEVLFRDVKDLGYGRWMFMRRLEDGGVAFYVHNFQVSAIPGREYSPLNLDAAVANDRRWHIGTNAIEYRPDANGRFYARFFTFEPADANGVQRRALSADLDGRGEKFMPGLCITCHGGVRLPRLQNGVFPDAGFIDANLQALEPNSFEFADGPGLRRADQEAAIKFINQSVYDSFYTPANAVPGANDGSFLRELLAGWYGGVDAQGQLINDRFDDNYVPEGWRPDPADGVPPSGADSLYRNVLAPSCIVCHARRGSNLQSDVDFSSYEKFIGHAERIKRFVYDRGVMPAAFLHYRDFWDPDGIKPALLGAFLPDFDRGRDDGSTLAPGRPIADAGPDRRARSPARISATASRFAEGYAWRIVDRPPGADAARLEDADGPTVTLVSDVDGVFTLELVVGNARGNSSPASVRVEIDANAARYGFETDIKPLLAANCAICHAPAEQRTEAGVDGIPVFWTDNEFLYQDVLRRVDFEDPLNSLLLLKPSGNHHFGGLRPGFDADSSDNRGNYDLVLDWILQGAPRNAP